jgi:hypothetical protein
VKALVETSFQVASPEPPQFLPPKFAAPSAFAASSESVRPFATGFTTRIIGPVVVRGAVSIVAVMVTSLPTVVPVSAARYVPFPMSWTLPIARTLVPPLVANVTVAPPVCTRTPAASLAVSVAIAVLPTATPVPDSVTTD